MENITFVRLRDNNLVQHVRVVALLLGLGLFSSFSVAPSYHSSKIRTWSDHVIGVDKISTSSVWDISGLWDPFSSRSNDHHTNSFGMNITALTDCDGDGVTCDKEEEDGTDPEDPCDFILAHQNCTPTSTWKNMDCDGDGVTNQKEKEDGTDPLDPCDLVVEHQNCTVPDSWKKMDCDGDGVTNEKEIEDGTDPFDPCDLVVEHQNCTVPNSWKNMDCDGDGVTNGKEKEDGTDPLDPCDFVWEHQNCAPSDAWKQLDCDGDGVTNGDEHEDGTNPLDPCDYNPDHVTLPQSGDYLSADCDGDGVTNEKEIEDGTDPLDPCDFVLEHQNCAPSDAWKQLDCDGDGVTNGDEKEDGTDPLDPCDYNPDHVTLPQSGDYLTADCDGDGVTNGDEKEDGTDPNDACDFVLGSQTVDPSSTWNSSDCDGDGVTNGDEKEDGTDPLDPCDYKPESVTLTPSADWEALDCDNDGNPNGTDPNPLKATAMDDSGSTPALTQVAINILENDDYLPNNDVNNLGITALSQIGGNALGTVTFDADTGFIIYTPVLSESNSTITVIYQVCNVAVDPNVCASATVTIQVGANTIDAVDDAYTTDTNGGTISDSDVLDNDTLNGTPVTPGDVILTSTPTDELTINEDGSITVNPGTSEGTYTISYTICEAANPSNCDTATVTVEVTQGAANVIDAVDDSYNADTTGGIISGSDVLDNDTLNGASVTLEDVILNSTPTDELTINEDGSVSVNPGTTAGTYTISYTICEAANMENCDTATVTVVVTEGMANVIDAVDDAYAWDTTSGVITDSNVLDNDTLNGVSVTLADVILTSTPTDELTINEDGSVSVNPGTVEGTYTITYTICEAANLENCDTATVTVEVTEGMVNIIDAVDDAYGADALGLIPNSDVLDNDTLNGESVNLDDVILTSTPTDELIINQDGSVTVIPGTKDGTYTISYTICEASNPENCDTAIVTVTVDGIDDDSKIEVNQMLTPNGDLKNDFLFIRGVDRIRSSTLQIFNRWGVAVYEGKNYDNVNNVFDGRSRGRSSLSVNDYLPAGVYFYIFNYETDEGSFTDSEYIYISR
ncbi:gliding motility-associated C-terminal domain-containing protein [Flagellimonas aequoris]|uniref:Gliding motility-associated C-terminal domain-containing protein n=1 Tax=Flagellimonas aequoris TaxID=2306997 RepID=A0A418N2J6_9FLAO|nr:gliding motility-associated C-terminal domain-containing protein [Allomuricauda aequoris]RIV67547.1 hypothetical protein D2U88_18630 [Allomuricauda aequoris]TXJ99374.1 hypothetical protein FQ019_18420 [Allomuricauda aequoris]